MSADFCCEDCNLLVARGGLDEDTDELENVPAMSSCASLWVTPHCQGSSTAIMTQADYSILDARGNLDEDGYELECVRVCGEALTNPLFCLPDALYGGVSPGPCTCKAQRSS